MRFTRDSQSVTIRLGCSVAAMCVASNREMSSVEKDPFSGAEGSSAMWMRSIGSCLAWLGCPGSSHGTRQTAPDDWMRVESGPWISLLSQLVLSRQEPSV